MKPAKVIALLAIAAIVLFLLYVFNPVETPMAPKCLFKQLTGWSCPGCGMQRFLHAMLHGRFSEAIAYNYLLLLLLPYLLLYAIGRTMLKGRLQQRWRAVIEGRRATIACCIIAPAWFVLRNILHI
ncbi:MAG: DUF2752 domain-containing protein [Prevotella sp.]|nr:DUF2752 domain-containing protein [Prevotella sp.]